MSGLSGWLRSHFPFAEIRSDGEVELTCPWCMAERKAWFNVRSGRGTCFKCRKPFGSIKLICQVDGVSWGAAKDLLKTLGIDDDAIRMCDADVVRRPKDRVDWPPNCAPVIGMGTPLGEVAREFCRSRGLDDEGMVYYGVRVCWDAGPCLYRLVLPYFDPAGNLLYWAARRIDSLNPRDPKLLYPAVEGRNALLYNLDVARMGGHAVLVEGQIDAIHVGHAGVGLGGSSIGTEQVRSLREAGFHRVTVMLDADSAGEEALVPLLDKLVRHPWRVDVARVPAGAKDPGEAGQADIWREVDRARVVEWADLAAGARALLPAVH